MTETPLTQFDMIIMLVILGGMWVFGYITFNKKLNRLIDEVEKLSKISDLHRRNK